MASQEYASDYQVHAGSFTIFPRDASGKPGLQYPWNSPHYAGVSGAINQCRYMLRKTDVRNAFETLAMKHGAAPAGYSGGRPPWYLQAPNALSAESIANDFIGKVYDTFPNVFVDSALKNPDNRGFHSRREWDGKFEPGHQSISIHGMRTDQMADAFLKQNDDKGQQIYREFLFMTAHTLLHELAHVFITYLNKGREATPPNINALSESVLEREGEAGRFLENQIFGGTLHYFHDPINGTPDNQCGAAYLRKASGAYYRILPKTIKDTATGHFKFPYDHDGSAIEGTELRLFGEGYAPDIRTDPLKESEVAYLLK